MSLSPSEHDIGVVGVSIALVERQIGVGERDGEEAREVDDGVEKERLHGES